MSFLPSFPILDCAAAGKLEGALFQGDEAREWTAMQRAGEGVARGVLRDFEEIDGFPANGRILVLVGKGHNGGDALIAAQTILRLHPASRVQVFFVFGEAGLRPLAQRAWREVAANCVRIRAIDPTAAYDLCLDGVFGFQFRAPADERVKAI